MNTDEISSSAPTAVSIPQRMLEALTRLQSQTLYAGSSRVYIYDLVEQRTLHHNQSVTTMLGYAAADVEALEASGLATLIHPEDLDLVSEYFQRLMTLRPKEVVAVQYRMQRVDGSWCWLRSQETPLMSASDGFPLQILGLVQDITYILRKPLQTSPLRDKLSA